MTGLLILAIFLALAFMMYSGKLPALVALPILALGVCLAAAVPYYYLQSPPSNWAWRLTQALWHALNVSAVTVSSDGAVRLEAAIFTVMLGGIFGQLLKLTNTAESMVRRVAELAGDSPFWLSLILTLAVSFLFTTISGLGSAIMVATIFFPILLSLGVPALLVGCLLLIGMAIGGLFNLVNLAFYLDVLKMPLPQIFHFVAPFGIINLVGLLLFLEIEFRRARLPMPAAASIKAALGLAVLLALAVATRRGISAWPWLWPWMGRTFLALVIVAMILPARARSSAALLSPFVPIGLVVLLGWPINAAFIATLFFLLRTARIDGIASPLRLITQAAVEGLQSVAPAIAIMMGIGMVLVAVAQNPVAQALEPIISRIIPSGPIGYLAFFTLLAPLALYRGPLNLWGMGSGLMSLIQRSGLMGNNPILAGFMSTGQIQGVCDPTNTQNVWIANQLKIDLNAILRKTMPYMWGVTIGGLLLGLYLR